MQGSYGTINLGFVNIIMRKLQNSPQSACSKWIYLVHFSKFIGIRIDNESTSSRTPPTKWAFIAQ